MSELRLKILITGGSRGLGRLMAEYMASQGHSVYVFSKTPEAKIDKALISMLKEYIECDISNLKDLEKQALGLINRIGKIDVLINNATVKSFKMLDEFLTDEIWNNINVDFSAPAVLTSICLPVMKRNKYGRIINISSISAFKGSKTGTIYCGSKSALITFTETLSKELSDLKGAVTVNAICPDAFSSVDGSDLENHKMITESILENIDSIIKSKINGRIITAFTFRHKMRERFHFIRRALFMS